MGSQSSVSWDPNVLAASKMAESVCVCSAHENIMLLVDAMDLEIQRPDQEDRLQPWEQQMHMHWCESCPGTATLKEFLDQELNEHEDD